MKYYQVKSHLISLENKLLNNEKINLPYTQTQLGQIERNYDITLQSTLLNIYFQVQIGRKKVNFISSYLSNQISEILVTNQLNSHYNCEVEFWKNEFLRDNRISPVVHYLEGPIVDTLEDENLDSSIIQRIYIQIKTLDLNCELNEDLELLIQKLKRENSLFIEEKNPGINYIVKKPKINYLQIRIQRNTSKLKQTPKYLTAKLLCDENLFEKIKRINQISEELKSYLNNK